MSRYRCPGCDYVYDEARGEAEQGFAPGTPWQAIPQDWCCPVCFVREKPDFLAQPDGAPLTENKP